MDKAIHHKAELAAWIVSESCYIAAQFELSLAGKLDAEAMLYFDVQLRIADEQLRRYGLTPLKPTL